MSEHIHTLSQPDLVSLASFESCPEVEDFSLPHEQKSQREKSRKSYQKIIIKSLSTSKKDPKPQKISYFWSYTEGDFTDPPQW